MRYQLVWILSLILASTSLFAQERKLKVDRRENLLLLDKFNSDNAEEAHNLIQAANVLIRKKIVDHDRDILLANKASYYLTLIRVDLLKSKKMELSQLGHSHIVEVEGILNDLETRRQTNEFSSNIILMRGLLNLYKNESYVENFTKAISLNPSSASAPWMSFMLAEHYFEKEDYLQAKSAYLKYFNKNNDKQREFATYKLAWCMISLKDYTSAEKYLAKLLVEFPKSSLGADPVKDLAYVSTLHRNDAQIVSLAKVVLGRDSAKELDYLMTVVGYRELRQQLKLNSPLLQALSKIKEFSGVQYKYHLSVLRSLSKEYASKEHFLAFTEAKKHFSKEIPKETQEIYQLEAERMIKGYYETYTAKVKSPENWSRKELNSSLRSLLAFHIKNFVASPIREQVLTAQIELCTEVKEFRCMLETHLLVLNDKRFVAKHEATALEICKIWDDIYKKNPKKFREKSIVATTHFLDRFPNSKHSLSIAIRLSEYLQDDESYAKAAKVLDQAYEKTASEDLFFRLQSVRFKDKQFASILDDHRMNFSDSSRLLEVKREAALQKAVIDKKSGNLKAYENSVNIYLASKPPLDKARLVRKDFLSTLVAEKDFDKLSDSWNKLDPNEKKEASYKEIVNALWVDFFKKADFAQALAVLPKSNDSTYLYLELLSSVAAGRSIDLTKLAKLDATQRAYLQSLVLLSDPVGLWRHYEARSSRLDESEKSLALWAYRLSTGNLDVPKNNSTTRVFGPAFAYSESDLKYASLSKKIASLQIPRVKSMDRFTRELEFILAKTKKLRKAVSSDMEKLNFAHRSKILKMMFKLEQGVAAFILGAPVPKGLAAKEIEEYKAGLAEAASEYNKQAQEYMVAADSIDLNLQAVSLPLPPNAHWPSEKYSQNKTYQKLKNLSTNNKMLAAVALWDLLQGEEVKDKEKYYRVRVSLTRSSWEKSPMLRAFISEELKQNGYARVLDEWRVVANVQ